MPSKLHVLIHDNFLLMLLFFIGKITYQTTLKRSKVHFVTLICTLNDVWFEIAALSSQPPSKGLQKKPVHFIELLQQFSHVHQLLALREIKAYGNIPAGN